METAVVQTPGAADTRQRLIDVAVDLFTRHSFAGTSLQMIADEMGFTKAAIYYHFRTREELLGAVVEPIFDQLSDIITAAETQRGANARADYMLRGYAELAVANRALVSVLACDPSVTTLLRGQPDWADLINRQLALLAGAEPDPGGLIKATVALAGISSAVGPAWIAVDDVDLLRHLVDTGRRTLGLRSPRRPMPTSGKGHRLMKTAVVTGGASGIGRAIAQRLGADGHHVATIDRQPSEGDFAYTADVTDRDQVDAALGKIRTQLGPVSILVNAAGLDGFSRFTDIAFDVWQRVLNVNLNGVFHCCQAVIPEMVDAGWGRIVNISSSSTHSGVAGMAHYVAAKSAVNGLTKSLALEYGPSGITVNAVPPGFIDTPMLRSAEERGHTNVERALAMTPVRRMGRPEDIAAACAFLVSEEAGYITGQILGVNGGRNT